MLGSQSYGVLGSEILPAMQPLMAQELLTVNLEGMITWMLRIAIVAVGQTVEAPMAVAAAVAMEIKEPIV